MTDKLLTSKEAYLAMHDFLESYNKRCSSDEISGMLGGMSLLNDGDSADPAYMADWDDSVKKVLNDQVNAELQLRGLNDT